MPNFFHAESQSSQGLSKALRKAIGMIFSKIGDYFLCKTLIWQEWTAVWITSKKHTTNLLLPLFKV